MNQIERSKSTVGKRSEPAWDVVERAAVRKFAEAIGNPNLLYVDEAVAKRSRYGALVAPRAFEYGEIEGMGWPAGGMLHSEHRIEYEGSPVRVGEEVHCYTELKDYYEKEGRGGLLGFVVVESSTRRPRAGAASPCRTWGGHAGPQKDVGGVVSGETVPTGEAAGDELEERVLTPATRLQLIKYAEASGDFDPIHTMDEAAKDAGLPGVIAHGMLILATMSVLFFPFPESGNVKTFRARFSGMVLVGDVLSVGGRVTGSEETGEGRLHTFDLYARKGDDTGASGEVGFLVTGAEGAP